MLRAGDTCAAGEDDAEASHPNQYLSPGILRLSWRSVGKDLVARDGVEGHGGRGLAIVASVSGAIEMVQEELGQLECDTVCENGVVPMMKRWYDLTPSRLKFGRLQDEVMPWARYPVWSDAEQRWEIVPYATYVSHRPGRRPQFGILDVMTAGGCITYMDPASGVLSGSRYLCRPVVVQRGNASCISDATEAVLPALSLPTLRKMSSQIKFGFMMDITDADKANMRKQEFHKTELPDNIGAVNVKCCEHQAHRIIESREKNRIAATGKYHRNPFEIPK